MSSDIARTNKKPVKIGIGVVAVLAVLGIVFAGYSILGKDDASQSASGASGSVNGIASNRPATNGVQIRVTGYNGLVDVIGTNERGQVVQLRKRRVTTSENLTAGSFFKGPVDISLLNANGAFVQSVSCIAPRTHTSQIFNCPIR